MKQFFTIFFTTLGVIFFVLILAGMIFVITDPYNIKPLIFGSDMSGATNSEKSDKNPLLTVDQEKVLEKVGIDPSRVPASITPEQEACFIKVFGEARVNEIKAGGTPTTAEYFQAQSCF